MKKNENLEELSDSELFVIAKEKGYKGCASDRARVAQSILWHRAGCPFAHPHIKDTTAIDEEDEKEFPQFYEKRNSKRCERQTKKNLIPERCNNSEYRKWKILMEEEDERPEN